MIDLLIDRFGKQERLKKLLAVCNHAIKMGMQGVNISVFKCVKAKMKTGKFEPKTIPYEMMQSIENIEEIS